MTSAIIPLLFFFCQCQYKYDSNMKIYYNSCAIDSPPVSILLNSLIYLTYACAFIVLLLYLLIFFYLRKNKRSKIERTSSRSTVQMKLLKQSLVIFILYACSMISVFILSFIDPGKSGIFDLAYAENLLNLSIAAVYPICFLAMSGDMKSILISKLVPSASGRVASVTLNNNVNNN
ncbi:hypothetical protein PENTCL1PPCAC_27680, partial [Pristionchus entomophagus]